MTGQMWSKWSWRLVLAVALLWMQQAGLRHDIDHALHDQDLAAHVLCQECLGHHGAQASLPSAPMVLPLADLTHAQAHAALALGRHHAAQPPYLSRAPPLTSA